MLRNGQSPRYLVEQEVQYGCYGPKRQPQDYFLAGHRSLDYTKPRKAVEHLKHNRRPVRSSLHKKISLKHKSKRESYVSFQPQIPSFVQPKNQPIKILSQQPKQHVPASFQDRKVFFIRDPSHFQPPPPSITYKSISPIIERTSIRYQSPKYIRPINRSPPLRISYNNFTNLSNPSIRIIQPVQSQKTLPLFLSQQSIPASLQQLKERVVIPLISVNTPRHERVPSQLIQASFSPNASIKSLTNRARQVPQTQRQNFLKPQNQVSLHLSRQKQASVQHQLQYSKSSQKAKPMILQFKKRDQVKLRNKNTIQPFLTHKSKPKKAVKNMGDLNEIQSQDSNQSESSKQSIVLDRLHNLAKKDSMMTGNSMMSKLQTQHSSVVKSMMKPWGSSILKNWGKSPLKPWEKQKNKFNLNQ